jgi:hypothetical protein
MFRARIRSNKKEISLGVFDSAQKAADAYARAASKMHGEYGRF